MGSIDRLVVDARAPSILTFKSGAFGNKIFYDCFNKPAVKVRCPWRTRLVDDVINGDKINSVISSGNGAYFLLGNEDKSRFGNSYLGFINSSGDYSFSRLSDDTNSENSVFLEVFDGDAECMEKSSPHLLLAYGGMGYTSLHELEHGKTDLGGNKFSGSYCDLIWSNKWKSFLILKKNGGLLDMNGRVVGGVGEGTGDIFGHPISDMHYNENLVWKLARSKSYEDALVLM